GLQAPGREDLRRAVLGRGLPGRRRVHPAQARRTLSALRAALQGGSVMRRLRRYLRLARIATLLLAGLALASAIELGRRIGVQTSMARKQRLTCWFLARLARALPLRVRIIGDRPREPMLWVANHISWSDIPLLGALLPISFLAKAEVRQWPVLGWLAQQAGTLFIRRNTGDA